MMLVNSNCRFLPSDTLPGCYSFWLTHGLDRQYGGILTSLDRDGRVLDTDKSVWFQGRSAWTFATLYNTIERRAEWLLAARSCIEFLRRHCLSPQGKMYFSVTHTGRALRMRRYVYSEAFAAIGSAAFARAAADEQAADDAIRYFVTYLHYSFEPGVMLPKFEATRPMRGIGPLMITIATAQEIRHNLGDLVISGRSCTQWIDHCITQIQQLFLKPRPRSTARKRRPQGEFIDHHDGRTLNPGHAIECAWFIMQEGAIQQMPQWIALGSQILDWMWNRGWDHEYGGLFYFGMSWLARPRILA